MNFVPLKSAYSMVLLTCLLRNGFNVMTFDQFAEK